jgi:hypothetical protein
VALFRSVPLSFSQTVEPKLKSASMVRKMGAVYREDGLIDQAAVEVAIRLGTTKAKEIESIRTGF